MRTPSLRRRVVGLAVPIVVVVVAAVEMLLYITLRTSLLKNLDQVLAERAQIAQTEARRLEPAALAIRLTELGIRATVRANDGTVYLAEPPSSVLATNIASPVAGRVVSREAALPQGGTVEVYARRAGVDDALRKLVAFELLGLTVATGLAAFLLQRGTHLALKPLRDIAASARRTSAGHEAERLKPDDPTTSLGQLASTYDDMVDSLECAIQRARHAQTESEALHEKSRRVIELATDAFVAIDATGTIIDWNRRAEEAFGWSREEAIGRTLANTILPPDVVPAEMGGLERVVATGEWILLNARTEWRARHRDGHELPVEVALWATPGDGGPTFNAFVQDISERRRGEETRARLAAMVDSAREAIFSTSLEGTILSWNQGAEFLYDFTAEEAIGQPDSILVPRDRRDEAHSQAEEVGAGKGISRYETVHRSKNGAEISVAVTVSPIRNVSGTVVGVSAIVRDITEQRWMAETLNTTFVALQDALEEARASEELSRRFLADAAHQLRTPVAGIRACAETLLRGAGPDQRDRLLADLVRETAMAGRLITALLSLARLDEGRPLALRPTDLVALCASEVDRARASAPDLDVVLRVFNAPTVPPSIDGEAIGEILANLLDNARRHARRRIDVTINDGASALEVIVADDGMGVPPEAVASIFQRFVSVDGKGGSGLGLPIAKGIAEAHAGRLTCEQRGFVLSLPVGGTPGDADGRAGRMAPLDALITSPGLDLSGR